LGSIPVVVVSDYKLIVETFQKDGESYAGRLVLNDFEEFFRCLFPIFFQLFLLNLAGPNGVVFVDGELNFFGSLRL
jgi:hypothetical protein